MRITPQYVESLTNKHNYTLCTGRYHTSDMRSGCLLTLLALESGTEETWNNKDRWRQSIGDFFGLDPIYIAELESGFEGWDKGYGSPGYDDGRAIANYFGLDIEDEDELDCFDEDEDED